MFCEELFPSASAEKNHKIHGIGGVQFAGEPIECRIVFSSDREVCHKLKPMHIPGKSNLVILGRDFMGKFGSTEFDWHNHRVRIGDEWIFMLSDSVSKDVCFIIDSCKIGSNLSGKQKQQIRNLLSSFCEVFAKNSKAPKLCTTEIHRIFTKGDMIVRDKVRRIPDKWKGEITKQVNEMLENGIIRKSTSPYNSNPHLVCKSDKSRRFVIDFRSLNKHTIPDTYPLPDVNEIIELSLNCSFLTQLDLASGYWCIEINEDDKQKTAFSVPNGKYECNRMPFGLKNAQGSMQRVVDKIKNELLSNGHTGVDAYVDNIFIFSETFDHHLLTLKAVLEAALLHNLSLKPEKCEIGFDKMDILGYEVSKNSVKPSVRNIQKLIDFPVPNSKKQLQGFLGLANFNRKFVHKFAAITKPLTELLSDKCKFEWTERQQAAFDELKQILSHPPVLGLPDFNKPFTIQLDASEISAGGILYQYNDNNEKVVIGYHSKTLKLGQKNWSPTEREMYAIKTCTEKWSDYCNGKVIIKTDHEPLKNIRNNRDSRGKFVRWILELESIDYTINYVPGKINEAADALSRVEIKEHKDDVPEDISDEKIYFLQLDSSSPVDINVIKEEQDSDKFVKFVKDRISKDKKINKGPFRNVKGLRIEDGILLKGHRIVIPQKLQKVMINEIHGQYHTGTENTVIALKSQFWWKRMVSDTENQIKDCQSCKMCKDRVNPKAETTLTPEVPKPRDSISMDVGSMPLSARGMCCFLLIVDLATRFVSVAALGNQTAEVLKQALWSKWFSVFGIPTKLRSDQGKNVDGKVINDLCEYLSIAKKRSSPYHPEGNGLAERSISSIKSLISVMCESRNVSIHDWDLVIYEAVLAHNSIINKSTKYSPFMCMFSTKPQMPIHNFMGLKINQGEAIDVELINKDASKNSAEAKEKYKVQADKQTHVNKFEIGQEVLLKRNFGDNPKISPNWKRGPYYIEKIIGPVNFAVKGPLGTSKVIHHNNIKPVGSEIEASKTVDYTSGDQMGCDESLPVLGSRDFDHVDNETHVNDIEFESELNNNLLTSTVDHENFRRNVLTNSNSIDDSNREYIPVTRSSSGRNIKQTQFYGID